MKIGRNEPCHCGSGKKYKKCCIEKDVKNKLPETEKFSETPEQGLIDYKNIDQIEAAIEKGNIFYFQNEEVKAYAEWVNVWEMLKEAREPEMKNIDDMDRNGLVSNWCQDYELVLGNLGINDPAFLEKRIKFCQEFVELFPDTLSHNIENTRMAEAESYYSLGRPEEGEKVFKLIIKDYPESAWPYIRYADMYWLFYNQKEIQDYDKAEKIYLEGLEKATVDRKEITDRLKELEEKRNSKEI